MSTIGEIRRERLGWPTGAQATDTVILMAVPGQKLSASLLTRRLALR